MSPNNFIISDWITGEKSNTVLQTLATFEEVRELYKQYIIKAHKEGSIISASYFTQFLADHGKASELLILSDEILSSNELEDECAEEIQNVAI